MSNREYCASHVSSSSISAPPSSKPSCVFSIIHSYLFQESTNRPKLAIYTLISKKVLPFSTCESSVMVDIILKAKKVPREYKIPSGENTRKEILDAYYTTTKKGQTSNILI